MANFNAHLTGGAIAGITAAAGALAMGWVGPLPALAVCRFPTRSLPRQPPGR